MPLESNSRSREFKEGPKKSAHALHACAEMRDLSRALDVIKAMPRHQKKGIDHHTCVVDCFARSGDLTGALAYVEEDMACTPPNIITWQTVLCGARAIGEESVGREVYSRIQESLDAKDSASIILLAEILEKVGKDDEAKALKKKVDGS